MIPATRRRGTSRSGRSDSATTPGSRLEKWDRKKDLPRLTVPTPVIGATHDTDDQKAYFPGLIRWLKAVDAGKKRPAP